MVATSPPPVPVHADPAFRAVPGHRLRLRRVQAGPHAPGPGRGGSRRCAGQGADRGCRPRRHRPRRAGGRRFRCLRQWRVARQGHDPRGPLEHRRGFRRVPEGGEAQRRARAGPRRDQPGRRNRRPPHRRLLRRLHGPGRHRPARSRAAAADFRQDQRDRQRHRPRARARRGPARRRRSAQRDQLRDRAAVRPVRRAGAGRSAAQHGLPAAGRPRHAEPRLLPVQGSGDGRDPRQVQDLCRRAAEAGQHRRRRREGRCRSTPWKKRSPTRRPRSSRPRTCTRPTTRGRSPTSRRRRRASTGRPTSRPRGWPTSRSSTPGSRARSPSSPR